MAYAPSVMRQRNMTLPPTIDTRRTRLARNASRVTCRPAPIWSLIRAGITASGSVGAPGAREQLLALASDVSSPAIARASAVSRLDRIANPAERESLKRLLQ